MNIKAIVIEGASEDITVRATADGATASRFDCCHARQAVCRMALARIAPISLEFLFMHPTM